MNKNCIKYIKRGFVPYKDLVKSLVGKVLEKILVENILLFKGEKYPMKSLLPESIMTLWIIKCEVFNEMQIRLIF